MAETGTSSPNETDWACGELSQMASNCLMSLYSLVFVVGLILNGFTLYFCQPQQQVSSSSVPVYLRNLAAADFLLCLCLPLRIANYATRSSTFQHFYCSYGATAFYLNMYASILFMGYIAASRYLKIVRPFKNDHLKTVRGAYVVSTVTWVVLLTMSVIYISSSVLTKPQSTSASANGFQRCITVQSSQASIIYKVIHTLSATTFICVLFSLVFFYRSMSRRLSVAEQKQPASPGSKKLANSRRKMLVLVSVFCFCFVPYHLVRVPYALLPDVCSRRLMFYYLKEITVMVSVCNIVLDPLIYFTFSKVFRAQLTRGRTLQPTQVATHMLNEGRRSSNGWLSSGKVDRGVTDRKGSAGTGTGTGTERKATEV